MSFLKAVLIAQIVLVLGMANDSDALSIRTGIQALKWPITLPFRILNFCVKLVFTLVRAVIHGLAHVVGNVIHHKLRLPRSLPEPAAIAPLAAQPMAASKLSLFGPGGMLTKAANYAV